MNRDEFRKEIEDFIHYSCSDWFMETAYSVDFSDEDFFRGVVELKSYRGESYQIPIIQHKSGIAIEASDVSELAASGEGLFCYLWHLEADEHRKLKAKLAQA